MKAWIVFCAAEWCTLIHAETPGKAKSAVMEIFACEYLELTAHWLPGMDGKPFTYQAAKEAGFWYLDDWDGDPIPPEDFIDDCPCEICEGE
jgi:hypothetical protein